MANFFVRYPTTAIATYPTFADFPTTAPDGTLALALDTDNLYAYNATSMMWVEIGGPGAALSLGALDAQPGDPRGADLVAGILTMQSASATEPGLVNTTTQSLAGAKTFLSALSMNANQINNLATPSLATDAATKGYVDAAIAGLTWLAPVAALSTVNVPLTGSTPLVIDGYTVLNGDRLALKTQTTPSQQGIYTAAITGGSYTLTVVPSVVRGDAFLVLNGTVYTNSSFVVTSVSPIVFTQFDAPFVLSIGAFDSQAPSGDGLVASGNILYAQSASISNPGMVNTTAQSFAGAKTFTGAISASNLSGTNTGDVTLAVFGSTPNANGLSLSGQVLNLQPADATHSGGLSSTDWNTFNNKQASGSYITALTGDGTASGPGSAALTLATVNSNVGSFGDASHVSAITVNAKGLVTAAASTSIQIAESQVTNLITDLAAKQSTTLTNTHILVGNGSNIATDVALSGDATLANTGAMTLATVNSNVGTFASVTVNGKGLVTAAGNLTGDVTSSGAATTAAATQANIATLSRAAGVAVHGTNTNDDAAAGFVGEVVSTSLGSTVAVGTSGSPKNIMSISLTAGDWDVEGTMVLGTAVSTVLTMLAVGVSTSTGAFDSTSSGGYAQLPTSSTVFQGTNAYIVTGRRRISLSGTTTVFLVGQVNYTTISTTSFLGDSHMLARRVR